MIKRALFSSLVVAGMAQAEAAIVQPEQVKVKSAVTLVGAKQKTDPIVTGRTLDPDVHKRWLAARKKRKKCPACFKKQPYPGDLPDKD